MHRLPQPFTNSSPLPRRQLLGSLGLVTAGAGVLQEFSAASENPVVAPTDRHSTLRIRALHPHICRDRVYVKIETNTDLFGWGEIKGVVPSVAAALATEMFALLDNQNPTRIEHIWQTLYRAERNQRGGAFMVHCIAGIDMALWDIAGKLWNAPVYQLLGGPTRDRIRVYPSAKAVKIGSGPRPQSGDPFDIDEMVTRVREARERLGPQGTVMFDAHSAVPPATLIQFASRIEPANILFLEEPAVPGNIEVFKRLKQQIGIPLALGERDRTIWGVIPYLTENAIDILQPDCGYTGGITQMKKIAALAEAFHVPLAPHCTQSYLGMTASFHVTASIPLFLIHESYDNALLGRFLHPHWKRAEDGHVSLPEGPGLGIDVDEKTLLQVASDPNYRYRWRGPRYYPDGSVADY